MMSTVLTSSEAALLSDDEDGADVAAVVRDVELVLAGIRSGALVSSA
jgi:hypothetical protein